MSADDEKIIQPGDTIVVSGADTFLGSHIVDQLLLRGYPVRGTVPSAADAGWLATYCRRTHPSTLFTLLEFPDLYGSTSFDHALKNAAGLIHVATAVSHSDNPQEAVAEGVRATQNVLRSAAGEPGLRKVTLTASSKAAADLAQPRPIMVSPWAFNDPAVKRAFEDPPDDEEERWELVDTAVRVEGGRSAWRFLREQHPGFELNVVVPACNVGPVLDPKGGYDGSSAWFKGCFDGSVTAEEVRKMVPQHMVDVRDTARIHIGTLIYEDMRSQRLLSYAYPFNVNDVLAIYRELCPNHVFMQDQEVGRDHTRPGNCPAQALLQRMGFSKFTSLRSALIPFLEGLGAISRPKDSGTPTIQNQR